MPEPWRLAVAGGLLVLAFTFGAAPGGTDDGPVELQVRNAGAQALRCVTVLAHFVSLPATEVAAGGMLTVTYFRGAGDGTLYVLRDDGRQMMVENLICGSAADWDATRGEIPLLKVRSSADERMSFACWIADRLVCDDNG